MIRDVLRRHGRGMLPALAGGLLAACGGGGGGGAASPPPAPPPPPVLPFADATAASNIAFVVGMTIPPASGNQREIALSTFGGVAAGDCEGDGDVDLFITYGDSAGSGPGGPNRLYLNQRLPQGNGLVFAETAQAAGVANTRSDGRGNDRHSGPTFADMDGDGDLDLFIGGVFGDPSRIYRNDGDCRFTDVTANSPDIEAMTQGYSRWVHTFSAAFGDYDLDGDLDMFLTHWGTLDSLYPDVPPSGPATEHLWENVSDASGIRFVNASAASGISAILLETRQYPGSTQGADFTLAPSFARLDLDLWPDIAIAGDFGTSQVAINNGDGTFRNLDTNLAAPLLRDAQNGMGSALGDVDNDGDLDWFITSIFGPGGGALTPLLGNRFYTNNAIPGGTQLFIDETTRLGVANGGWGWAACFLDLDNDGDLDIYHTNGWPEAYLGAPTGFYDSDRSRAYVRNAGGTYGDAGASLGLNTDTSGRAIACADFDLDGDLDIFEMTDASGNSARLWRNDTAAASRNALRVKLTGLPPNTEAAGARIFLRVGGVWQMREIMIGSNYTSQNPTVQVFGMGPASRAEELRIEWPAIDAGTGPEQPPHTVITGADPRLAASAPGVTLDIRHPGLP